MQGKSRQQLPLSSELLGEILSHLQLRPTKTKLPGPRAERAQRFAQYYQLRLVCKQFNDAFVEEPRLSRHLFLPEGLPGRVLPSLLQWLRHYANRVESYEALCGVPVAEVALSALQGPTSPLTSVETSNISTSALHILSSMASITSCNLSLLSVDGVDQGSLEALPCLQNLHLQEGGRMHDLKASKELKSLYLSGTIVYCSEECGFAK